MVRRFTSSDPAACGASTACCSTLLIGTNLVSGRVPATHSMDEGALGDGGLDHRPDRPLLHVGQHAEHDLAAALDQAEDRRLVLGERAPAGGAPQPPAAAGTPPLATAAGFPLCPATTWTSSIPTSPSSRAGGSLAASP